MPREFKSVRGICHLKSSIFYFFPGGKGAEVEIDESKFGKRKYHKGHPVEGQWVFGGIQRKTGDCFLVAVENRTRKTLLAIIKKYIKRETTIHSDCWKAYDVLGEEGYNHLKVNHSVNFVDPKTGCHTNTVESMWRHAKSRLPVYNRRKKNFAGYLAKFMFLKHCKMQNKDAAVELVQAAAKYCQSTGEFEYDDKHDPDDTDDDSECEKEN